MIFSSTVLSTFQGTFYREQLHRDWYTFIFWMFKMNISEWFCGWKLVLIAHRSGVMYAQCSLSLEVWSQAEVICFTNLLLPFKSGQIKRNISWNSCCEFRRRFCSSWWEVVLGCRFCCRQFPVAVLISVSLRWKWFNGCVSKVCIYTVKSVSNCLECTYQ